MDWQLKPARDIDLSPRRRLTSRAREWGLVGTATRFVWWLLVRRYLRWVHRLTVTGRAHLPEPPFVMIANHASHLDALTLAAALPWRLADRACPLAAGDTFFTSTAAAAFAAFFVNALPIRRQGTTADDLALLRARLAEDGLILILFPEGTRARDGVMARFRAGIGTFVAGTPVPVVPCWLDGAFAALPPDRRWPRPARLTLAIGPALSFADVANDRAGWAEVARRCEAAVRALQP